MLNVSIGHQTEMILKNSSLKPVTGSQHQNFVIGRVDVITPFFYVLYRIFTSILEIKTLYL